MINEDIPRNETLVQMELESLRSCDFASEEDTISDLAKDLHTIVGSKPVVTLGRSYSISDAFLERARLPRSQSQKTQLNSLLYKDQNPDWNLLVEFSKNLPEEPFIILDEFSFSGTKIVTTIIRLLRLGITHFQFISLVGQEKKTTEEMINQIKRLLNEDDLKYLEEHIDEVESRIIILQRKKTLLKILGTFTNIVSAYQATLEQAEIPKSSIFSDVRVTTLIDQKLRQITKSVSYM